MSTGSVVVHGSVTADGALKLDEKIPLPAGPVQITIAPAIMTHAPKADWWQIMQDGRKSLEHRGNFRSQDEINAERESFRAEN